MPPEATALETGARGGGEPRVPQPRGMGRSRSSESPLCRPSAVRLCPGHRGDRTGPSRQPGARAAHPLVASLPSRSPQHPGREASRVETRGGSALRRRAGPVWRPRRRPGVAWRRRLRATPCCTAFPAPRCPLWPPFSTLPRHLSSTAPRSTCALLLAMAGAVPASLGGRGHSRLSGTPGRVEHPPPCPFSVGAAGPACAQGPRAPRPA